MRKLQKLWNKYQKMGRNREKIRKSFQRAI